MYCIGSYAVPQILSVNPDMNIDSFVFPANDEADGQVLNSGVDLLFAVMEDGENKEAAYEVVRFMMEDENIQIYLDDLRDRTAVCFCVQMHIFIFQVRLYFFPVHVFSLFS